MIVTNLDVGSVELEGAVYQDETLAFPGADDYVPGTLLARRSVATAVTASAVTGTGNGTCTAAVVKEGPVVPLVGAYTLVCTAAATNGGTFKLVDPNAAVVATGLALTAGAGASTVFEVAGLGFTVTDGSTDFAAGDTFTLTVAADGKMVVFNPAGVGGEQIPIGVLTYAVSKAGAGNARIRALVAGRVKKERLIIDVDGSGANITAAILDQLRDKSIVAVSVQQLSKLDNQ